MAVTAIADIINPEVLADQISARFPDQLVLGNTSLVSVDSTFPLGSPGTKFKIPFWKRINAFAALSEGSAMTPSKITTNAEYAVVARAGAAYEVYDTAALVSKADPVSEIASQIARRAAEYIDSKLVLTCDNTPNATDYTSSGSNSGKIDQNAVTSALVSGLGDNYAKMQQGGAIIMHSKVYGDLLAVGAIQNQYQSGMDVIKSGMVPTLNGLPIYLSDLVTTAVVSSVTQYNTYIVGPEALALFYQRAVQVEFDRDILLQADVIAASVHFAPHLFGYDEDGSAVVAEQNKSIHVVKLKTK